MVSRVFSTRRQLAAVLVLVLAVLGVLAVQAVVNRPQTCTTTIPAEQDLEVALAYGAALESSDWKADYADHGDSISARWTDETGIGHLDYLRYNCGLTTADLDNYRFD